MAAPEDSAEVSVEAPTRSSKKLLVFVGGGLLVALLAFGAVWFFLSGPSEGPVEPKVPEVVEVPKEVSYISMAVSRDNPAYTVRLRGPNIHKEGATRGYLLQVQVTARVENRPMEKLVKQHKALLKSRLNDLFLQQTYETLMAPGGRILLERQANEVIRQAVLSVEGDPESISVIFDELLLN